MNSFFFSIFLRFVKLLKKVRVILRIKHRTPHKVVVVQSKRHKHCVDRVGVRSSVKTLSNLEDKITTPTEWSVTGAEK